MQQIAISQKYLGQKKMNLKDKKLLKSTILNYILEQQYVHGEY